jgi:hypothetical protein
MRLFDLSNPDNKKITEATWTYRLHLKDIFKNFQDEKINLKQAKILIGKRIKKFLDAEELDSNAEAALGEIVKLINSEDEVVKIDDLINTLYDIADEYSILVK